MPRFNLAAYAKKRKELKDRSINNAGKITEVNQEILITERILDSKRKELDSKRKSCENLDKKVM